MNSQEFDNHLKEIRERCDNATPGPWIVDSFKTLYTVLYSRDKNLLPGINSWTFDLLECPSKETVDFIASSREDVPWLLDQIKKLKSALEISKKYIEQQTEKVECIGPKDFQPTDDAIIAEEVLNRIQKELGE